MVDPSIVPLVARLEKNPEDAEALSSVWQFLTARKDFQTLAALGEKVAARRTDPESAATLFYRSGRVWFDNAGRTDKALACYEQVMKLVPQHPLAQDAAREIYLHQERYDLAVPIIEKQLPLTEDLKTRLDLLRNLAKGYEKQNNTDGQITALAELVRLSPRDQEVMRKLAGLFVQRGKSAEAQPDDMQNAAKVLAQMALAAPSGQSLRIAEAALEAFAGEETAYGILEPEYTAEGRIDELISKQISFLTANPNSKIAATVRRDLANHYIRSGHLDNAIETLSPLAGLDNEATRLLTRLLQQTGRSAELAKLTAANTATSATAATATVDPAQKVTELLNQAIAHQQSGDMGNTLQKLREILKIQPAHPDALRYIEHDLRNRGAAAELRVVLWNAAQVKETPVEHRMARIREVAWLCEQRLNDHPSALESWKTLLALDAQSTEARGGVERALRRLERWAELGDWYVSQLRDPNVPVTERKAISQRALDLARYLNNHALETQILEAGAQFAPEDDNAVAALVERLKTSNDHARIVELLQTHTQRSPQVPLFWSELGNALENLGKHDLALDAHQHARTLESAQPKHWIAVERALEKLGRTQELFETLVAHANHPLAAANKAADIYAYGAQIALKLKHYPQGVYLAEQAIRLMPFDESNVDLLDELYSLAQMQDQRLQWLKARVDATPDGPARIAAWRRLARALKPTDPEQAKTVWQKVQEAVVQWEKHEDPEATVELGGTVTAPPPPAPTPTTSTVAPQPPTVTLPPIVSARPNILPDEHEAEPTPPDGLPAGLQTGPSSVIPNIPLIARPVIPSPLPVVTPTEAAPNTTGQEATPDPEKKNESARVSTPPESTVSLTPDSVTEHLPTPIPPNAPTPVPAAPTPAETKSEPQPTAVDTLVIPPNPVPKISLEKPSTPDVTSVSSVSNVSNTQTSSFLSEVTAEIPVFSEESGITPLSVVLAPSKDLVAVEHLPAAEQTVVAIPALSPDSAPVTIPPPPLTPENQSQDTTSTQDLVSPAVELQPKPAITAEEHRPTPIPPTSPTPVPQLPPEPEVPRSGVVATEITSPEMPALNPVPAPIVPVVAATAAEIPTPVPPPPEPTSVVTAETPTPVPPPPQPTVVTTTTTQAQPQPVVSGSMSQSISALISAAIVQKPAAAPPPAPAPSVAPASIPTAPGFSPSAAINAALGQSISSSISTNRSPEPTKQPTTTETSTMNTRKPEPPKPVPAVPAVEEPSIIVDMSAEEIELVEEVSTELLEDSQPAAVVSAPVPPVTPVEPEPSIIVDMGIETETTSTPSVSPVATAPIATSAVWPPPAPSPALAPAPPVQTNSQEPWPPRSAPWPPTPQPPPPAQPAVATPAPWPPPAATPWPPASPSEEWPPRAFSATNAAAPPPSPFADPSAPWPPPPPTATPVTPAASPAASSTPWPPAEPSTSEQWPPKDDPFAKPAKSATQEAWPPKDDPFAKPPLHQEPASTEAWPPPANTGSPPWGNSSEEWPPRTASTSNGEASAFGTSANWPPTNSPNSADPPPWGNSESSPFSWGSDEPSSLGTTSSPWGESNTESESPVVALSPKYPKPMATAFEELRRR